MCPGQKKSGLEAASRKINFTDMAMILLVMALPASLLAIESRSGVYPGSGGGSRDGREALSISRVFVRWARAGFSWSFGPGGRQWGALGKRPRRKQGREQGRGGHGKSPSLNFPKGPGFDFFPR